MTSLLRFPKFGGNRKTRRVARSIALSDLRRSKRELEAEIRALEKSPLSEDLSSVVNRLKSLLKVLGREKEITRELFENLTELRDQRAQHFRKLQVDNNTFRSARNGDPLDTIILAGFFILTEGGIAATMLISEGKLDVLPGFGYGMLFAFLNVTLGLFTGFLPLRYHNFRRYDAANEAAAKVRNLAKYGLGVCLAAQAVLVFSAARLRALGTHEGVFSFDQVGFFETFNDSVAIAISIVGAISSVLSTYKGYTALADPIPDFAEAWHDANDGMEDLAEGTADERTKAIEDILDAAFEDIEPQIIGAEYSPEAFRNEIAQLNNKIGDHNDTVKAARETRLADARVNVAAVHYVGGRAATQTYTAPDTADFDELFLDPIDEAARAANTPTGNSAHQARELFEELSTTGDQAISEINAALAGLKTASPIPDELINFGGK